jgi:hypothetical protein
VLVRRSAAESDDVAVRVFNVKTLGAPRRHFQRLDDLRAIGDALFVECLDAVDARRGIEVVIFPTMLALGRILGRFFQMQFQSIQTADSVESAPRLAETETQPLVVSDRALKVVDEELRSERSDTRLGLVRLCRTFSFAGLTTYYSPDPRRKYGFGDIIRDRFTFLFANC